MSFLILIECYIYACSPCWFMYITPIWFKKLQTQTSELKLRPGMTHSFHHIFASISLNKFPSKACRRHQSLLFRKFYSKNLKIHAFLNLVFFLLLQKLFSWSYVESFFYSEWTTSQAEHNTDNNTEAYLQFG